MNKAYDMRPARSLGAEVKAGALPVLSALGHMLRSFAEARACVWRSRI